eukprot:TRINITY_DN2360_c0_g1_i1.p1 TRINITY_DN2360_c0_g1~~TRINITY_DN2360_c0_g1_i1.p1  ORF type:complete len:317 (-),score=73.08 TRINITY_DN2360_c0_g1_i1:146-994(-)
MTATKNRSPRRAVGVFLVLGVLAAPLAFIAPGHSAPGPVSSQQADLSRRGFFAAAAAAATLQAAAPALAVPEQIQVLGGIGKYSKINGPWTILKDQKMNERPVYKRDGNEFYLLYNDCGSFQITTKLSGECNGFAIEENKRWTIDGKAVDLKVNPIKSKASKKKEQELAYRKEMERTGNFEKAGEIMEKSIPTPEEVQERIKEDDAEKLSGFQLPDFMKEKSDDQLLFDSDNIGEYMKKKGGSVAGFLQDAMTLKQDEIDIGSRLEARLGVKGPKGNNKVVD